MSRVVILAAVFVLAANAPAADLTKIERRIAKEPVYQTKSPRYCLVVFGEDAATRVWLVLDGDTLYVDRNANGDLTEPDEKVTLAPFKERQGGVVGAERQIVAGSIRTGPNTKQDLLLMQLRVAKNVKDAKATDDDPEDIKLLKSVPGGLVTGIIVTNNGKALIDPKTDGPEPTMQMALVDHAGVLQFSDRPETAPIVHFGGPLRMALHPLQKLVRGQESELRVGIGTPGLGAGTFAMRGYQGVPNDAKPVIDFEFPHKDDKAKPIKLRVTLKERC
jgi:hypothetical protein